MSATKPPPGPTVTTRAMRAKQAQKLATELIGHAITHRHNTAVLNQASVLREFVRVTHKLLSRSSVTTDVILGACVYLNDKRLAYGIAMPCRSGRTSKRYIKRKQERMQYHNPTYNAHLDVCLFVPQTGGAV
jgi:hypothetical protein